MIQQPDANTPDAYKLFAALYPQEAYDNDHELFWEWFHAQHPTISREEMVEAMKT